MHEFVDIHPITKYGKDKLGELIKYQIYQPEILLRRQQILIDINKNLKIKNNIMDILKEIKLNEDIIDIWFNDDNIIKNYYFKNV